MQSMHSFIMYHLYRKTTNHLRQANGVLLGLQQIRCPNYAPIFQGSLTFASDTQNLVWLRDSCPTKTPRCRPMVVYMKGVPPPCRRAMRGVGRASRQRPEHYDFLPRNQKDRLQPRRVDLRILSINFFLVGGLEHFLFFHSVGNVILPTDFNSIIFQRVG